MPFRRLVPTKPIALGCLHHRLALVGTRVGLSSIVRTVIFPPSCVPFAPWELPRFIATTDALTSSWAALRPSRGMNTVCSQADLPVSCAWSSDRSVSNHLRIVQRSRGISPGRSLNAREFCSPRQASPFSSRLAQCRRPNRVHVVPVISGRCYGPVFLVLLLPTPCFHDAVTVQYGTPSQRTEVDFHHSDQAPLQAHWNLSRCDK